MLRNYIKVAFRNLIKYKGYSFINISGLSVGLACFFLITIFVRDELSYDRHLTHADNLYRIGSEIKTANGLQITAQTPSGWAPHLLNDYPEVLNVTRFKPPNQWWKVVYESKIFYESGWTFADSTAIEMFDFEIINGDPSKALSDPYKVIVSESMARKYFRDEDAIGKTFRLDNTYDFEVTAVFRKLPQNTHFDFDFLASFVTLKDPIYGANFLEINNFPTAYTYVQLQDGSDYKDFESKLPALIESYIGSPEELAAAGFELNVFMQPITEIHLFSHLENEIEPNARIGTIYIFSAIALFIIVIAGINFMNLTTARSMRRAREVGMRKTVGAKKQQLVFQFLSEAILISFIALFISLILVAAVLPFYSILIGKTITTSILTDSISIIGLLSVTTIIGLLSGLYPAFYISSYRPSVVLKGKGNAAGSGKAGVLRHILIIFQFAISIALIISTAVLYQQMKYIRNFDLGFNEERVVVVEITDPVLRTNYRAFKDKILQIPAVESASASFSAPADLLNLQPIRKVGAAPDENWMVHFFGVDFDFLETMEIELLAGRDITLDNPADTLGAVIINETAVKSFGWKSMEEALEGELEFPGNNPEAPKIQIIGVMKDIHVQSVHENITPMVMMYFNEQGYFYSFIRINADITGSLNDIEMAWNEIMPNYPFQYSFLDENFDKLYKGEQLLGRLLTYFAVLAIFIACLGLYGLASYMVEQRTKEIGVRKVLGASENRLIFSLSNEYSVLVLIAFLIASPIAYYFMNMWLQSFEYHVGIRIITFFLSLIFVLLASWITVSLKAFKAATDNPVNSLRSE
jgi:putative ABC transport system permease protein